MLILTHDVQSLFIYKMFSITHCYIIFFSWSPQPGISCSSLCWSHVPVGMCCNIGAIHCPQWPLAQLLDSNTQYSFYTIITNIPLYYYYFSTTDIVLELRVCIFTSQINKIICSIISCSNIEALLAKSNILVAPLAHPYILIWITGGGSKSSSALYHWPSSEASHIITSWIISNKKKTEDVVSRLVYLELSA